MKIISTRRLDGGIKVEEQIVKICSPCGDFCDLKYVFLTDSQGCASNPVINNVEDILEEYPMEIIDSIIDQAKFLRLPL